MDVPVFFHRNGIWGFLVEVSKVYTQLCAQYARFEAKRHPFFTPLAGQLLN